MAGKAVDERCAVLEARIQELETCHAALARRLTHARAIALVALLLPLALIAWTRSGPVHVGALSAARIEVRDDDGHARVVLAPEERTVTVLRADGSDAFAVSASESTTTLKLGAGGAGAVELVRSAGTGSLRMNGESADESSVLLTSDVDSALFKMNGSHGAGAGFNVLSDQAGMQLSGPRFEQAADLVVSAARTQLSMRRQAGDQHQTVDVGSSDIGSRVDLRDPGSSASVRAQAHDATVDLKTEDGRAAGVTTKVADPAKSAN
jgi:hypothetical protein